MEIASLAEEAREPTRTSPRAIILAVGLTSVLYVLVAMVATSVVSWEALSESSAPLALLVETVTSERYADALSVIALFATFNTVLLLVATGARVTYGMANRALLPRWLGQVSHGRGTPWSATVAVGAVAALFVFAGDIGFVAQVTNFAVFGQFLAVNGAMIALRRTQPSRPRPFKVRGAMREIPLSAVAAIAGTVLLAVFMERTAFLTGMGTLLLGVALSFAALRRGTRPGAKTSPDRES